MQKIILLMLISILLPNNQIPGTDQKRPILLRGGTLHTVSGVVVGLRCSGQGKHFRTVITQ